MSEHTPSESQQVLDTEEQLPRSLNIRVPRSDLKSSPNNALFKSNLLTRILNRLPLFDRKRISVQASFHGTEDTILYCPETAECDRTRATSAEFIRVNPRSTANIVKRGDEFEVSFIGMSATPHDVGKRNNNELFLYSLLREQLCHEVCRHRQRAPCPPEAKTSCPPEANASASIDGVNVPTGIPQTSDVPFIHYDPLIDGHDEGATPDSFVPIPASKRLYYRHSRDQFGEENCEQVLNVRFTLMEIDKVSDILARAPASVDQLGSYVSQTAGAVPYMALVAKAISFATELGRYGIKEYSRPDHVMSVDAEFLLAEPEDGLPQKEGDYLRYGYYFFLSEPVDAQVYAQTCSSSQHMPLMLKRESLTLRRARKNEKLYFPLTGVSYLVMKVSKGCKNHGFDHTRSVHDEHKMRIENMLQMRDVMDTLAGMNGKSRNSRKDRRK